MISFVRVIVAFGVIAFVGAIPAEAAQNKTCVNRHRGELQATGSYCSCLASLSGSQLRRLRISPSELAASSASSAAALPVEGKRQ